MEPYVIAAINGPLLGLGHVRYSERTSLRNAMDISHDFFAANSS